MHRLADVLLTLPITPQAAHPRVLAVSSMWVMQSMSQGQLLPQQAFKIPHMGSSSSSLASDSFYGKSPAK